jgi:ribose transport system substrate-binding protein
MVRWRAIPALAVLAAAAVIAGCGSSASSSTGSGSGATGGSGSSSGSSVRVAYFGPASNGAVTAEYKGEQAVAAKTGAHVTLIDTTFSAPMEIAAIQDALVSKRYNAFIVLPLDARSIQPVIKSAIRQGIKVDTINLPPTPKNNYVATPNIPGLVGTVENPFFNQANSMASLIVSACGSTSPCKVGWIPGDLALPNDQILISTIQSDLKSHPGIQFIIGGQGQYLTAPSIKVSEDLLTAHPDLNVIATAGDQMTLGAEKAVESAGKQGKIKLLGIGASVPGVAAVRAGRFYGTVLDMFQTEGAAAMQLVVNAVEGKPLGQRGAVVEATSGYPQAMTFANRSKWSSFVPQWTG